MRKYRLSELYDNVSTNSLSRALLYEDGDVLNLHYGDIHLKYAGVIDLSKAELPFALRTDYKFKESSKMETGDVIFADAAEDYEGIGKAVEIGETDSTPSYAGLHTIHLKRKTDVLANGYMGYLSQAYAFRRKVWFIAQGTKVLGIASKGLLKQSIVIPNPAEQNTIVSRLKAVDQKINLLTKKKEALDTYKKGLMQKVFSQELRFKDEDGTDYPEWDTHYVAELGEFFNGLSGKNSSHFGHGDSQYVQYSQVFRHSYIRIEECGNVEVDDSDKQHALKVGDALFTTSSEVADEVAFSSILLIEPKINTYLNSFCFGLRLNDLLTPSFAQYLFRTTTFRKAVYPLAQGSTRYNVSKKEVGKVKLLIPSVEEQNHISKSLRILDSRIDQLILLKNKTEQLKKGLLQKMFV